MKKSIQLLGGVNAAAAVAVLAILLIVFQFFFLDQKLRNEARSHSIYTALLASKEVTNSVQNYFRDAYTLAKTYSGNFPIYRINKIPRYSIYQLLKGSLTQNNKFLAIWTMWEYNAYDHKDAFFANDSIHDSKGYMSIAYYYHNGVIKREINDTSDYSQEFYTIPKKSLQPVILDPFNYQYHGNPHPFVETSLVYPIKENGRFLGVIGVDIDLNQLLQRYKNIKVYNNGRISILTNSGRIVTNNDSVYIGKNLKDYLTNADLLDSMKQGKTFSSESISKFNGQKVMRFFFPINIEYLATPWYTMVEIPQREIYQFANSLRIVSSVILFASLLLLLYLIFNSIDRRKKLRLLTMALNRTEASEKKLMEANQIIVQNEQLLNAIFNQTYSFIGLTTIDGILIKSNKTALRYINKKEEDVINQPFWKTPWWSHSEKEQEKLKNAIKEAARGNSIQTEVTHTNSSGKEITLLFSLKPVFDEKGDIIYLLPEGMDITSLKENELKFRSIFNLSPDAIYIGDYDGPIIEINPMICSLTGYSPDEIFKRHQLDLIPEKYHQLIRDRQELIKKNQELGFIEAELIHKDGSLIPIELNSRNIRLNNTDCRLTVVRDLRERKTLQRKLIDTIIETEENERRRFAGDLHDDLGPHLAAMRIYASSLKRRMKEPEQLVLYNELMEMIKNAIINVRELSVNLSPYQLNTYGLIAAIDSEIENKRNFFSVQFEQNINETRFEPNIETILYRIVKELLNNTMKYAHATKVILKIKFQNKKLYLDYFDNGIGFNFQDLMKSKHNGIGLLNIQHRINSIQGSCSINSQINQGFSLSLEVPALPLITN